MADIRNSLRATKVMQYAFGREDRAKENITLGGLSREL